MKATFGWFFHLDIRKIRLNCLIFLMEYPYTPGVHVRLGRLITNKGSPMALALYYVVAIAILIMHYTGFLQRNNMEWLVFVIAVSVFPAVLYL